MNSQELNDPDFDSSITVRTHQRKQSALEQIPPKTLFVGGIVMGIMILCAIGFFILLTLLLRGDIAKSAPVSNGSFAALQPSSAGQVAVAPSVAQAPTGTVPPVTKADHIRGDKNAPFTWIEYSDMECPFCKKFHPTMLQMVEEYKGKVRWIYRHFPLSFHQNAQKEAEASECANELGGNDAFWKYTDRIFERTTSNGTGFALDDLVPLAKEIGLNESKFKSCLDSGKYATHVQQDETGGQTAGVNGTPGSFLLSKDGKAQLISGALPYASIKADIDAQLNK